MSYPTENFGYYPGASWMTLDGKIYIVPGFHDEWIQEHPELTDDNKNILGLVLNKRWISVVVYAEGYVEFCINNRRDCEVLTALYNFLLKNYSQWENTLIMPLKEEGFIQVSKAEFSTKEEFMKKIALADCLETITSGVDR